jgi:glycosyltransferase involved in cell wall biosynthesis
LFENETSFWRRAALALEWRKMRRHERIACSHSAMTVAVSKQDRESLRALCTHAPIQTIPTGVDTAYFVPGPAIAPLSQELVFSGSMDWHPNDDAMRYFIDEVLPMIRQQKPGVTLTVVGRNPPLWLRNLPADCGVNVTGTVADIRPWIEKAAVFIVPLRIGGGTRLKIFEALAMGKAVVSTTIGAEGLPLEENVQIKRADTAQRFAGQVLALLDDPAACQRLGNAGRRLMEAHYGWPRVAEVFELACRLSVKSSERHETAPFPETAQVLGNFKD